MIINVVFYDIPSFKYSFCKYNHFLGQGMPNYAKKCTPESKLLHSRVLFTNNLPIYTIQNEEMEWSMGQET